MAIEGNDWWAIAGAAAGGLAAGVVGSKLIRKNEPVFTGLRRWYKSTAPTIKDETDFQVTTVWFDDDGFFIRSYEFYRENEKLPHFEGELMEIISLSPESPTYESGRYDSINKAINWTIPSESWIPISEWGYQEENVRLNLQDWRAPRKAKR